MVRVLVVDDVVEMRSMIRSMLESAGHEVTEANNGRAAIKILQGPDPIDLLVTDILMPEADGLEVIRAASARPELGIIAISGGGNYMPAAVSLAMSEAFGARKVLFKPFRKQELLDAVSSVIAGVEEARRRKAHGQR
jgi:CheY-like chemotaxis protein